MICSNRKHQETGRNDRHASRRSCSMHASLLSVRCCPKKNGPFVPRQPTRFSTVMRNSCRLSRRAPTSEPRIWIANRESRESISRSRKRLTPCYFSIRPTALPTKACSGSHSYTLAASAGSPRPFGWFWDSCQRFSRSPGCSSAAGECFTKSPRVRAS